MKYDKTMTRGNLDNIVGRLIGCHAVLDIIHEAASDSPLADAIAGATDLLRSIYEDLEANISAEEAQA